MIKLTFLGTGQAIPTVRRNHTSILLSYANENILVDCGEGTQRQFRIAKLNPCKITRILITHWHGDHILGLPGLLQTLALNNYNKTLYVYGPKGTKKFFSLIMNIFIFAGKLKVQIEEINESQFLEQEEFALEAFNLRHGAPTLGFNFILKDKLRINKEKLKKLRIKEGSWLQKLKEKQDVVVEGKKISWKNLTYTEKGKKISIIMDTLYTKNLAEKIKNSELFICESTYTLEEKEKAAEYKHLTAKQAAEIAKQAKAKKLILTHISQRYENSPEKVLKEAKKVFKNTILAEDFMTLKI